jgi:hypothetical protein
MHVRFWPGRVGYRWTFIFQIPAVRRDAGSDQRGRLHPSRIVPSLPLEPTGATCSHTMKRLSTEELPDGHHRFPGPRV